MEKKKFVYKVEEEIHRQNRITDKIKIQKKKQREVLQPAKKAGKKKQKRGDFGGKQRALLVSLNCNAIEKLF